MKRQLLDKVVNGEAVGGIVGLGYVGLPLVQHLCEAGYRVVGFDVDEAKTLALSEGRSYIEHVDSEWIAGAVQRGAFCPTTDYARLKEVDCVSICVPTPLDSNREPDLSYVESTVEAIAEHIRPGCLVVLESTTYPGTTRDLVVPILERSGRKVGKDLFVAFSPEREDPGNRVHTIRSIPKVVGGVTPDCAAVARAYYGKIFESIVEVTSPDAAELTKLLENIFRSVNIALVNELKMLCGRMGIDIWEVIDAAATKPFGYMPFYPGPGLGGHCIPIDPYYLSWKAREYDFHTRFIELAGDINTSMPEYVTQRIMDALNEKKLALNGARVLVLGIAYKKNVDDTRESPAFKIMELLQERGADVEYNDPHVPHLSGLRHYDFDMTSVEVTAEALGGYDCTVLVTDHDAYDYDFIVEHASLIVDTRNATRSVRTHRERIVKA